MKPYILLLGISIHAYIHTYVFLGRKDMCAVYGIGLSESSMYSPKLTKGGGSLKKRGGLLSSL